MVAAAVVGAAVVGAAATTYASNKAADAQSDAVDSANANQRSMYDQTRADQAPYRALASDVALPGIKSFLANNNSPITAQEVMSDPGYQFGLDQGTRTLQNSAAARGGLYSGATLKALNRYGNDYATTKFGDTFNRINTDRTNQFNRLATAAGIGQTANNQVALAGQNYTNNVGSNIIGAGNAQAASALGTANAWTNAINGVSSYGNQNNWFRQSPNYGSDQYGNKFTNEDVMQN
jgi:hypothetical protein